MSEQTNAWLTCPECDRKVNLIRDGVCLACHYTLNGGSDAPDDLLRCTWEAWLATGTSTA